MADLTAPPRDSVFAGCVGKPQQQIAVACQRRAKADEVMAAQFVQRTQQMMLIAQPALVIRDDGRGSPSGPILNGLPHLLPRPM